MSKLNATTKATALSPCLRMRGATTVEFALCFVAFLPLFFGVIELARYAYMRNAAAEAVRLGARTVAACDANSTTQDMAVSRMREVLPQIPSSYSAYVTFTKTKSDMSTVCSSNADCAYVTVTLTNVPVATVIPLVSLSLTIPTVSSTVPREIMSSTNNSFCS